MPSELLKGFRLLDLTDEKGALCGKMFADLGAEVIKVEPPADARRGASRRISKTKPMPITASTRSPITREKNP